MGRPKPPARQRRVPPENRMASKVPVAFIVFNRPATTEKVFSAIRDYAPKELFVLADAPRPGRDGEAEVCAATRQVTEMVDWPCQVHRKYRTENAGCRRSVSEGLDWVFAQVEHAVILEDDCLPDPTFFKFCGELLARYSEDPRVGMISGNNFQRGSHPVASSYYFSRHCHIWGWATWRRSWQRFDPTMRKWPGVKETNWLHRLTGHRTAAFFWKRLFDDSYHRLPGGLDTWDVPWTFDNWIRDSINIVPRHNLVSNIGFGAGSTHTMKADNSSELPVTPMPFPLVHPETFDRHESADVYTDRTMFYGNGWVHWLIWTLRTPFSVATMRRWRERFLWRALRRE